MKKLIIIFLTLSLFSCKKESEEDHINKFPAEVRDNVRLFLSEAKKRNVNLDIKKIHHIKLIDQEEMNKIEDQNNVVGFYDHDNKSIYLDTSSAEYKKCSMVILFHELGHGLLHREHRNDFFVEQFVPASIMNCCRHVYINEYTMFMEEYYFDELFNENTPRPLWASQK